MSFNSLDPLTIRDIRELCFCDSTAKVAAEEMNSETDSNDETEEQEEESDGEEREKRSSKMNNYRSNFAYACPNGNRLKLDSDVSPRVVLR